MSKESIPNPKAVCPNSTCRECFNYKFDASIGDKSDNYSGSSYEQGKCNIYGHVYAGWIGYTNIHQPNSLINRNLKSVV